MVSIGSILSGTFRFVGSNVRSILVWSGVLFLMTIGMMVLMRPFYQAQVALLQRADATPAAPPFGSFLLALLFVLIVSVVLLAGAFRAVFFPDQARLAYLRLGMDELRLLGCALILVIGFYLLMIVAGIVLGLAVLVGTTAFGASPTAGAIVIAGVSFVLSAWLVTRLSLALPMTLLERKIVIGPAWRLTRGHFWQLLGAYVVIFLVVMVAYAVIFLLRTGPSFTDLLHPRDQAAAARVATAQLAALSLTGRTLVIAAVTSVIGGFAYSLCAGVAGIATAQLTNRGSQQHLGQIFE